MVTVTYKFKVIAPKNSDFYGEEIVSQHKFHQTVWEMLMKIGFSHANGLLIVKDGVQIVNDQRSWVNFIDEKGSEIFSIAEFMGKFQTNINGEVWFESGKVH